MSVEQPGIILETLLQANPDIKAQRERVGSIWVTQDLHDGSDRVMTVRPLYQSKDQTEPAVAIEVRTMNQDPRTRNYSNGPPRIVIKPNPDGTVSIEIDEKYGEWDPNIDTQEVIRQTRIGLNLLQVVGSLPTDDHSRSRYAGRVHDEMDPQDDLIRDIAAVVPHVALVHEQIEAQTPRRLPTIQFVNYAVDLIGKMPAPPTTSSLP